MTPIQIVRNGVEMFGGPHSAQPSPLLRRCVGMQMASHWVAANGNAAASGNKVPPPLPPGT
jgi:hypothetical protein